MKRHHPPRPPPCCARCRGPLGTGRRPDEGRELTLASAGWFLIELACTLIAFAAVFGGLAPLLSPRHAARDGIVPALVAAVYFVVAMRIKGRPR